MRHRAAILLCFVIALASASGAWSAPPPDDEVRLPRIAGISARSHADPRLGSIARQVMRLPDAYAIRCWSREGWGRLGRQWCAYANLILQPTSVSLGGNGLLANIGPDLCRLIAQRVYSGKSPMTNHERLLLARGLAVIASTGIQFRHPQYGPARLECSSIQGIRPLARGFGFSRPEAGALAKLYLGKVYGTRPNTARSDKCRDGGAFDLDPRDLTWP